MIYQRQPWTPERRAWLSAIHRARHGAPSGYCTVHGIHVPFEHREPVRYWADWFAHNHGKDEARRFILDLKANDWRNIGEVRGAWLVKLAIRENREAVRKVQWEAYRANRSN